jgi:hypothetical protein
MVSLQSTLPSIAVPHRPLRTRELADLIYLVGFNHDPDALTEVINHRPVFSFGTLERLLLPDFLRHLLMTQTKGQASKMSLLWERAHDLTSDKFTVLARPARQGDDGGGDAVTKLGRSRKGVDCAHYYAALWRLLQDNPAFTEARGILERENEAAIQFQLSVTRNRYWSYREAHREASLMFVKRFEWCLNGCGKITVLMPKYLKGAECRQWLEKNVPHPNPKAPGEKERIQAIINERLVIPQLVPLDRVMSATQGSVQPKIDLDKDNKPPPSFVDFLAREKALSAELQRPSIRKLGPTGIDRLVHAISDNLRTREFTDEALANRFGVSKTSFSHFGGSDWSRIEKGKEKTRKGEEKVEQEEETFVPDLFRNAAALLSESEIFREMAEEAGVFRPAMSIANDGTPPRLRRNNHDR